MDTKTFSIYLITNNINHKQYVGKTSAKPSLRLKQHKWNNSNSLLHKAIMQDGIANFTVETIDVATSSAEALIKEKEYILQYNTIHPLGYNLMIGQSLEGGNNRMKGKCLPNQWKKHVSEAMKGEQNFRANYYTLMWLDTNETKIFHTRQPLCDYLGLSLSTIKKHMGKPYIEPKTQRPIKFFSSGRLRRIK